MRAHLLVWPMVFGCLLTACPGGQEPGPDGGDIPSNDGGIVCGNGVIEGTEECDDRNRNSGDGCSSSCISESPASCSPSAVVDLLDAGLRDGLFLRFVGSVTNRRNDLEPPTGCQDETGGKGVEVVHRFNLPVKADYLFTTLNTTTVLDSVLYQVDSCTPGRAPDETACNDDVSAADQLYQSTLFSPSLEAGEHFVVVDSFDLASSGLGRYQLDVQVRPVVGAAAGCDPLRLANRCEDGFTCPSDGGTCATGTAPTLANLAYLNLGANVVRIAMEGSDPDGDVSDFIVEFLDNVGTPLQIQGQTNFPLTFDSSVLGQTSFRASWTFDFGAGGAPAQARVRLRDVSNYEGMKRTAALTAVTERANAAMCDAKNAFDRCVTGHFCQPSSPGALNGTCVTRAAPVLSTARAFTASDNTRRVSVDATDTDGDIVRLVLTFKDAAGTAQLADVLGTGTAVTPSVVPFAQFYGTTTFKGVTGLPAAAFASGTSITQVGVKVRDSTGLESAEVNVPFNTLPEVAQGQTCDARKWDDVCVSTAPLCEGQGVSGACGTVAASVSAVCAAAPSLTLGTPVTGALTFGADRWRAPCSATGGSGANEKVFKFTTTAVSDVKFTTDFPETTLDTVVYVANACASTLNIRADACSDDIDFRAGNFKSEGYLQDLPAGTYFVFLDAWTGGVPGAGTGDFKLLVEPRPVLTASGVACDPLLQKNRCGLPLRCTPNAQYNAFTCQ